MTTTTTITDDDAPHRCDRAALPVINGDTRRMTADVTPLVPAGPTRPTLQVEPMHLSVNLTYDTGATSSVHVMYDGDLAIGKTAGAICGASEDGALVLGLGVDQDHDEVHWMPTGGADGEEMLQRGIEVLTVALEATRSAIGKAKPN